MGQERALTALRIQGRREFSRHEYEDAAGIGRSAAADELRELVRHGILVVRGAGPATRYAFSAATVRPSRAERRGRPEKWTDATIERELRAFLADRTSWPSPGEFRVAGKGALYSAASKKGGVPRWRRMMGL